MFLSYLRQCWLRRAWPYLRFEATLDTYELDWVSDIVLLRARAEHTLRLQPVLSTSKQLVISS